MWTLVQAGSKIYGMSTGGVPTEITLPTDISLDTTRKLRVAVLNRTAVLVNSPTVNTAIDSETGQARGLVPRTPAIPPTLASGAGTGLSGVYKVRYSFGRKDRYGRVLAESPLSPEASVTLTNTGMTVSDIRPSVEDWVNVRFIYRTTAGGDV